MISPNNVFVLVPRQGQNRNMIVKQVIIKLIVAISIRVVQPFHSSVKSP